MYCATDWSVATMSFNDFSHDVSSMNLEFGNLALILFFFLPHKQFRVCVYVCIYKQDSQYYNGIPPIIMIINLIFIGS